VIGWRVERVSASAAEVHGLELPEAVTRVARVVEIDTAALVLGSAQPDTDVDRSAADRLGIEVVHRRSGGGAVLLEPGATVWIDVEIGRDDPLWDDDVGRAALWLGRVWVDSLAAVGVDDGIVHRGPMERPSLGSVVCFAGLASGEVTVGTAKVVGISQRRTRGGARFQCAVPLRWDRDRHVELLAPGLARVGVDLDLETIVVGSGRELTDAFLDRLP